MLNFEKFKEALRKRDEERYKKLNEEIKKMRDNIERILTMILESSSNQARSSYSGLDMY